MNRFRAVCVIIASIVIAACGGGGGTGGGSGPSVKVTINPKTATVVKGGTVTFSATVANATNTSVTFSATGGTFSNTSPNQTTWTAPPSSLQKQVVTATSNQDGSTSDSATITVTGGATISGAIIDELTRNGVPGVGVRFVNSSGTIVASATTNTNGVFSVEIPGNAVSFRLAATTIPAGYYQQFEFKTIRYSTIIDGCDAPLPSIPSTGTLSLANIKITPTSLPPPPPPNGCN